MRLLVASFIVALTLVAPVNSSADNSPLPGMNEAQIVAMEQIVLAIDRFCAKCADLTKQYPSVLITSAHSKEAAEAMMRLVYNKTYYECFKLANEDLHMTLEKDK